jgi:hypothetical protein
LQEVYSSIVLSTSQRRWYSVANSKAGNLSIDLLGNSDQNRWNAYTE